MLIDLIRVVRDEFLDVELGEPDLGQDLVDGSGPCERSWVAVPRGDVGANGPDQDLDGCEGAAADGLAGDDAEPGFNLIQPARALRGEVEVDVGIEGQPRLDVRGGVG